MNPLRYIAKKTFDERLNTDGPSHTFARLCTSRHVDDLQGIATLALAAMALLVLVIVLQFVMHPNAAKDQIGIFTAVLAVTAGAVSWAYQSGSRRLGAVDLFASEIGAICRVCLIVDFANGSIARVNEGTAAGQQSSAKAETNEKFTSEEKYTPVFDNNISELQSLDFDVVKNVTNFYTYRKTMMDFMRKIAVTSHDEVRRHLRKQMIYMQYLMYESARLAIDQLIEFEPDRSECLINILCSELVLFDFLMSEHDGDFMGERLKLRLPVYARMISRITADVTLHNHTAWDRARTTEPLLVSRYAAMQIFMPKPLPGAVSPNDDEAGKQVQFAG